MKKLRVVIDVDGTLINTDDALAKYYNHVFSNHPDFVPADGMKIYYYNCDIQMPLLKGIPSLLKIFDTDFFWNVVELKEGAVEYVRKLVEDERFEVVIWSYGSNSNHLKKRAFLMKHFPFVKDIILSNGKLVNKSEVATGGVIIDDHPKNLKNPKAFNILFMDRGIRNYNKDFKGIHACDWEDAYQAVVGYYVWHVEE